MQQLNRALLTSALVTAAAIAVASPARGDVDAEVLPGDRVSGTLTPASEREVFRLDLPAGARITAKATGARKGPAVRLDLVDPTTSMRARGTEKGTAATLANAAIDLSGTWVLQVTSRDGVSTGGYKLSVKVAVARRFAIAATALEPATTSTQDFAAPAGSLVRAKAKGKKGAVARLLRIDGPEGFTQDLDGAASARDIRLPLTGTYTLTFQNGGDIAGDLGGAIQLTPRKTKPRKLDFTTDTLGGTDETAVARVIAPEGGSVLVPDLGLGGGLTDISGASVTFPAGALVFPTSIVVGTTTAFTTGSAGGALGATVFFGPEKLTFGTKASPIAVTVSIPIDLASVFGDTTRVVIYVRDAAGKVTEVPGPYDFDARTGYVSFPTTHFSSYRAFARPTTAPPNPRTLITIPTATYLVPAPPIFGTAARFFVCDGTQNTVKLVSGDEQLGFTSATYVGGGVAVADGADRLAFDLQGPPTCVKAQMDGSLYVGTATRIFMVTASGTVSRIAGTGVAGDSGDNGPATSAQFSSCVDLLVDLGGNVTFVDNLSARVRRIQTANNMIVTEFGTGSAAFGADGVQAATASLVDPTAINFAPMGGFLIADGTRIRSLDRGQNRNVTIAGDPAGGAGSGDSAADATLARFTRITSFSYDQMGGKLYVVDRGGSTIRLVTLGPPSRVNTIAGQPLTPGQSPDGAAAPFTLEGPYGVSFDMNGNVIFLETSGRVRFYAPQ